MGCCCTGEGAGYAGKEEGSGPEGKPLLLAPRPEAEWAISGGRQEGSGGGGAQRPKPAPGFTQGLQKWPSAPPINCWGTCGELGSRSTAGAGSACRGGAGAGRVKGGAGRARV